MGLIRALRAFLASFFFVVIFLFYQFRVVKRVWDGNGRYNSVGADRLGYGYNGAGMDHRKSGFFNFLNHRCTATSACASGRSEKDCINSCRRQFPGNGLAEFLGIGNRGGIAHSCVIKLMQAANGPFRL